MAHFRQGLRSGDWLRRAPAPTLAASPAWWHSDAAEDLVMPAGAGAFFARYGLRCGFGGFEIGPLAAAGIVRRAVLDRDITNDAQRIAQA